MALMRVGVIGRALLSRGSPAPVARSVIHSLRITTIVPQRQFIATTGRLQGLVGEQTSGTKSSAPAFEIPEAQRLKNARSIVIKHVPRNMQRPELQAVLKNCGIETVDFSLRYDGFKFNNKRTAFVELASEQQAQDAVTKYNLKKPLGRSVAGLMNPETKFVSSAPVPESRLYQADESGVSEAIKPIIDRRRCIFSVVPPAWADLKAPVQVRNENNRSVVEHALNPFGVESISRLAVNWGDKKQSPRYLCHVDFKTKQGAEQAIRTIDGTEVKGIKVRLEACQLRPYTAYRIGRFDKKSLELLQAKGLAPSPEEMKQGEERHARLFQKE